MSDIDEALHAAFDTDGVSELVRDGIEVNWGAFRAALADRGYGVAPDPGVPFRTPAMGVVATFHTDSGEIIGPVTPVLVELRADGPDRFILSWSFEAANPGDSTLIVTDVRFHFGEAVIRHEIADGVLGADGLLTSTVDMTSWFTGDAANDAANRTDEPPDRA